jgi:hypothetical protein
LISDEKILGLDVEDVLSCIETDHVHASLGDSILLT